MILSWVSDLVNKYIYTSKTKVSDENYVKSLRINRIKIVSKADILKTFALIIIDPQNDFCDGGALAVPKANEIFDEINLFMIEPFKKIIITLDSHPPNHISFASSNNANLFELKKNIKIDGIDEPIEQMMWPDHCIDGTSGWEVSPRLILNINKEIYTVKKGLNKNIDSYSGFGDAFAGKYESTVLNHMLKLAEIKSVVLMGLATDYCVYYTAKDAIKLGYKTYLILNGCRGVNNVSVVEAINDMVKLGVIICKNKKEFYTIIGIYH